MKSSPINWRANSVGALLAFALCFPMAMAIVYLRVPLQPATFYAVMITTALGPSLSVMLCWLATSSLVKSYDWRAGAWGGFAGFLLSFIMAGITLYVIASLWLVLRVWMGMPLETQPAWRIFAGFSGILFWAQLLGPVVLGKLTWLWLVWAVLCGSLASLAAERFSANAGDLRAA